MIVVRIWEGLGNQLFQYAYARALKERGNDVYLDTQKAYDAYFHKSIGHTRRDNKIDFFRITLPQLSIEEYAKYDYLTRNSFLDRTVYYLATHNLWKYKFYEESEQTFSLKSYSISGNYYVKGWFQSEKYFSSIQNIIREELTPRQKPDISDRLSRIVSDEKSVSLHVRRGDYEKIGLALPKAYYLKAMDTIEKTINNPQYIVFSDDTSWVKRKINRGNMIFANEIDELVDVDELYLMSKCRSHIISNSTFGWWGAWLDKNEDKIVIAPKTWYSGQRDIVPHQWVVV